MKKLLTAALLLSNLFIMAQGTPKPQAPKGGLKPVRTKAAISQAGGRTIKFKDGKTYKITGEEIGSYTQQTDGKPNKRITTYYIRSGNNVTVTVVKDWIEQKSMDELKVYKFSIKNLSTDGVGDIGEIEADEYQVDKTYTLNLTAQGGKTINFDTYTIWEFKPNQRTSSYFTIEIVNKEMLEKVKKDITALLPKEVSE